MSSAYEFSLKTIDNTTALTCKDLSCNTLIVNGVTLLKSEYDNTEFMIKNQFLYDSANPKTLALATNTTLYTTNLLFTPNTNPSSSPFASMNVDSLTSTPNNSTLFTKDSSVTGISVGQTSMYVDPTNKRLAVNKNWFAESNSSLEVNGSTYTQGIYNEITTDTNINYYLSSSTGTTPPVLFQGFASNATAGSNTYVNAILGKDATVTNYNGGIIRFNYIGSGNLGNNIQLQLSNGAKITLDGNGNAVIHGYLDTTNSSVISFPRFVQTSPPVMALNCGTSAVDYSNSTVRFSSIHTPLDNGTTGTTTLVNTALGLSYNPTTGLFTCTSSSKRRYLIQYTILALVTSGIYRGLRTVIRIAGSLNNVVGSVCNGIPQALIDGGIKTANSASVIYSASTSLNTTFDIAAYAYDTSGNMVAGPLTSVSQTAPQQTYVVIMEV